VNGLVPTETTTRRSPAVRRAVLGWVVAGVLLAGAAAVLAQAPKVTVGHGLSMHGDMKYGPGFKHFEYVNPAAPKGGEVKLAAIGTFDNLNPFILKGVPAVGIGETFDSLTVSSRDEPFTEYGLIAETIEVPEDRSWVAFTLRPEARFHDGSPITVEDVIWSFETLKTQGHPFYRSYYAQVAKVEKVGERKVRFAFGPGENRELPLIVGQLPVLSRTYWSKREFDRTTLEPPLGSGAYRVDAVEPGRSITYRRVPTYWAARLPVKVGTDNFDVLRYDYYRDGTVALEAFKGGEYDFRAENVAKNWATAYTGPAISQGLIRREEIPNEVPTGMQAFVYNTRRPFFQDARVRRALAYAFDFEWTNKNLFYGAYTRTRSYFSNSELASRGLPSPDELKILEPFRGRVPEEVFTREYQPPVTDGSGNIRDGAREALRLLGEAGWSVKGQKLVNARGEALQFEILEDDPLFDRVILPFVKNLERLGVSARLRVVDAAQYQKRIEDFDFDMTVFVWPQSLSPGNEQRDFWSTKAAETRGTRNVAGIRDPVVDTLIDLLIKAPDRKRLVDRTRALDRVLLWGHHVIPHWHIRAYRVAYWDKFARPAVAPKYALGLDTWWVDAAKEAALVKRRGEVKK
jgi:microcin C transport system substrate-binding protein